MTWLTVVKYLCHKWPRICSICRKHFPFFPHAWLITGFVAKLTRRVLVVEQGLLTLPVFSPGFEWGSCYSIFSFMCMFCRSLCDFFVLYLLATVLSILLRFKNFDYPLGNFKLFFNRKHVFINIRAHFLEYRGHLCHITTDMFRLCHITTDMFRLYHMITDLFRLS